MPWHSAQFYRSFHLNFIKNFDDCVQFENCAFSWSSPRVFLCRCVSICRCVLNNRVRNYFSKYLFCCSIYIHVHVITSSIQRQTSQSKNFLHFPFFFFLFSFFDSHFLFYFLLVFHSWCVHFELENILSFICWDIIRCSIWRHGIKAAVHVSREIDFHKKLRKKKQKKRKTAEQKTRKTSSIWNWVLLGEEIECFDVIFNKRTIHAKCNANSKTTMIFHGNWFIASRSQW